MDTAGERPRAMVLLLRDGQALLLGPVYGPERCDLGFVEDLLRIQVAARRLGSSIRLTEVRPDLRELVELVGLTTELVD
ncbi:MAG: hypothetical protein M3R01_14135 [Actinomycetota bacterium]|nr:hypothetical protein [Actinomycetota bacterium]